MALNQEYTEVVLAVVDFVVDRYMQIFLVIYVN
jgi:hypothetical protein